MIRGTKTIDRIIENLNWVKENQKSIKFNVTSMEDIAHAIGKAILSESYDEDLEANLKELISGFNAALIHRTETKLQLKFKKNINA